MLDLTKEYEVAIIDEIQMIGKGYYFFSKLLTLSIFKKANEERGSAWTRACNQLILVFIFFFFFGLNLVLVVLGLKAKEIHICGDQSALEIVKRLCINEKVFLHTYER